MWRDFREVGRTSFLEFLILGRVFESRDALGDHQLCPASVIASVLTINSFNSPSKSGDGHTRAIEDHFRIHSNRAPNYRLCPARCLSISQK